MVFPVTHAGKFLLLALVTFPWGKDWWGRENTYIFAAK